MLFVPVHPSNYLKISPFNYLHVPVLFVCLVVGLLSAWHCAPQSGNSCSPALYAGRPRGAESWWVWSRAVAQGPGQGQRGVAVAQGPHYPLGAAALSFFFF